MQSYWEADRQACGKYKVPLLEARIQTYCAVNYQDFQQWTRKRYKNSWAGSGQGALIQSRFLKAAYPSALLERAQGSAIIYYASNSSTPDHGKLLDLMKKAFSSSEDKLCPQCPMLLVSLHSSSTLGDYIVISHLQKGPVKAFFKESSNSALQQTFSRIYAKRSWGPEGAGSGAASSIEATESVRSDLISVIKRYEVKSMMDAACGSMHWMPMVLANITATQPDFKFLGLDVACPLINNHTATFTDHSSWAFQCMDYTSQPLSQGYDLIYIRDSLQHLPFHATWMFLSNVRASGARLLMISSYAKHSGPNVDIKAGQMAFHDILKPPFSASQPLEVLDEGLDVVRGNTTAGKYMLLYDVSKMTWQDPALGL